MPVNRRQLLLATAFAPCLAWAQQPAAPQEGKEFRALRPPQAVDTGQKIEVLEFFQYTCPHCATYEPVLEGWRKRLPPDVEYRRVPITWDGATLPHVRIYYTLEALGKTNELHGKVFRAAQASRGALLKPDDIADFMSANGIDRKQWLDMYNSFAVAAQANRAGQIWRAYKIDGTPAMSVDGRYVTAPSMVGTREGSLVVLDQLIARARAERGGGAAKK